MDADLEAGGADLDEAARVSAFAMLDFVIVGGRLMGQSGGHAGEWRKLSKKRTERTRLVSRMF